MNNLNCNNIIDFINRVNKNNEFDDLIDYIKKNSNYFNNNYNKNEFLLGSMNEYAQGTKKRKQEGCYYTPEFIVKYILKDTVKNADIVENPFIKVLDPSCGSGYFLTAAYDILKDKFLSSINILNKKYCDCNYEIMNGIHKIKLKGCDYWNIKNIHYHILKNCLFGCDIDELAVKITKINLLLKDKENYAGELNIICCDSLKKWENLLNQNNKSSIKNIKFFSQEFDYIVGNPPYIGHKGMSKEYKSFLKEEYNKVFKDKSDISYCFLYRFTGLVKERLSFITSRYFTQSLSGKNIRKYIKDNYNIVSILDFYGNRIIKGAQVDPVIICLERKNITDNSFTAIKLANYNDNVNCKDLFDEINNQSKSKYFHRFIIKQSMLKDDGWIIEPENVLNIIKKIENKCSLQLSDVCESFQGIITGYDRAFILDKKEAINNKIEPDNLFKWIKSKSIEKYYTNSAFSSYLLYITCKTKNCKNSLKYLEQYKDTLINRKGIENINEWFCLHRSRDINKFINKKIIFPYKCDSSRFSLNDDGTCFSADIYGLTIKDENIIDYYTLVGILNSRLYEFYYKRKAKKLGNKLYEYYPNTLMKIFIPDGFRLKKIGELVKEIINKINTKDDNDIILLENMIDNEIEKYFNIDDNELKIIERYC